MSGYLLSVVAAALVVGAIGALVPEGEGGGTRRTVCFLGALCVLCVLVAPLGELMAGLEQLGDGLSGMFDREQAEEQYEQQYIEQLLRYGADNASGSLRGHICERYDIPLEQCHVSAVLGERDGELYVDSVTVILSGGALLRDPYEIEAYIGELLGCRCTVTG